MGRSSGGGGRSGGGGGGGVGSRTVPGVGKVSVVKTTFTESGEQPETGTFEIARRSAMDREQRRTAIHKGFSGIYSEDWQDEEAFVPEKAAAKRVGIRQDEPFLVRYTPLD